MVKNTNSAVEDKNEYKRAEKRFYRPFIICICNSLEGAAIQITNKEKGFSGEYRSVIRRKGDIVKIILLLLGILCLGYYLASVLYGGFGLSIIWIWLLGGVIFLYVAVIWEHPWFVQGCEMMPLWVKHMGKVVLFAGIAVFVVAEGAIVSGMRQVPPANLDYIMVLGCKVNGTVPSRALRMRLDEAFAYLQENPETKAILTGGQGTGEEISEAECMKQYLLEKGLEKDRIFIEDASTTTVENLQFSKKIVENEEQAVGIVTNNFHVFRSMSLAKKQGYENVYGIPAPTGSILIVHYMVREGIALLKEYVIGNI